MKAIEFLLAIIVIISIFIVSLFLWVKLVRLFKKKSYHYITPPDPENDPNWYPIDFSNYNCFIFIQNTKEKFIKEQLDNFVITENEFHQLVIKEIVFLKHETWIILRIKNTSFFELKFLAWWLYDLFEINKITSEVIGICQHKNKPLQDYLFKIDNDSESDNFIGSFRHGKNFGIYLPTANLNKSGNISLSINHEIDFYSELAKLPIEQIEIPVFPDK